MATLTVLMALAACGTNEVWITSRDTDPASAGTKASPFSCPNQKAFDATMLKLCAGAKGEDLIIHLLPGTYFTRGTSLTPHRWLLPSRTQLIGAGMLLTTLQVTNVQRGNYVISVEHSDDVEVRDLTLNAGGSFRSPIPVGGLRITGWRVAVRRVRVLDIRGALSDHESWAINIGGGANEWNKVTNFSAQNSIVVEDCVVRSVHGDYANGISAFGGGVCVSNNRVYMPDNITPDAAGHWPAMHCYNTAETSNGRFVNNYGYGGLKGFYGEGVQTNMLYAYNHLVNCIYGMHFGMGVQNDSSFAESLSFINNTIELRRSPRQQAGIAFDWAGRNLRLRGNVVKLYDPYAAPYDCAAFQIRGMSGVHIFGNSWDPRFRIGTEWVTNLTVTQNRYLQGRPVPDLPSSAPAKKRPRKRQRLSK